MLYILTFALQIISLHSKKAVKRLTFRFSFDSYFLYFL